MPQAKLDQIAQELVEGTRAWYLKETEPKLTLQPLPVKDYQDYSQVSPEEAFRLASMSAAPEIVRLVLTKVEELRKE